MKVFHKLAAVSSVVGLVLCAPAWADKLTLSDVNVIDVRNGTVLPHQDVTIEDGIIDTITSHSDNLASVEGTVIDGAGQYLMPGLIDAHAHLLTDNGQMPARGVMLANGITGYRQMNGSDALLKFKAEHALPVNMAPEILALPGLILNGGWVRSPEQAAAVVKDQQSKGADLIKVVDLAPDVYRAMLNTAEATHIDVAGHLPSTISVKEAANLGMDAIEHLGPRSSVLLSCSSDEQAIRAYLNQPSTQKPAGPPSPAMLRDIIYNPILFSDEKEITAMAKIIASFDPQKCRQTAEYLAAEGMWQVPTLIRLKTMQLADDPQFTEQPLLGAMPPPMVARWQELGEQFAAKIKPEQKQTLGAFFKLQQQVTRIFAEAGVQMAAGSDVGGQWVIPGVSMHQELALLAEAGLSNATIIKMATLNGAQLTHHDDVGEVATGKRGNVLLLAANPLENLHALKQINGMYYQQQWLPADAVKKLVQSTR